MRVAMSILLTVAPIAHAGTLDCGTLPAPKPEVEWKEVPSQNINAVDVTFIGKAPPNAQVDKILRQCAAAAVKRDASKDILVSGWIRKRPGGNPNDDDLLHPYGGLKFLGYDSKSKSIAVREIKLEKKR